MFKNRILQVKMVQAPPNEKPTITFTDPVKELERISEVVMALFIIYKVTDTACKIALHTATVKIK